VAANSPILAFVTSRRADVYSVAAPLVPEISRPKLILKFAAALRGRAHLTGWLVELMSTQRRESLAVGLPLSHQHSWPAQIGNFPAEQPKNCTAAAADRQRDIIDLAALTMQFSDASVYVITHSSIRNLQIIAAEVGAQGRRGALSKDLAELCFRRALDRHPDTSPSEFGDHLFS
jgi:hypothetical protein